MPSAPAPPPTSQGLGYIWEGGWTFCLPTIKAGDFGNNAKERLSIFLVGRLWRSVESNMFFLGGEVLCLT